MASYPRNVEDLIVNLKFIGRTQQGQKINFKSQNTISSTSPVGTITRWWYGEDKKDLVDKLRGIMDETSKILEDKSNGRYYLDIWCELIKVDIALLNLIDVYRDYGKIVSRLEMFRRRIEVVINNLTKDEKYEIKCTLESSNFDISKSRFELPRNIPSSSRPIAIQKKK